MSERTAGDDRSREDAAGPRRGATARRSSAAGGPARRSSGSDRQASPVDQREGSGRRGADDRGGRHRDRHAGGRGERDGGDRASAGRPSHRPSGPASSRGVRPGSGSAGTGRDGRPARAPRPVEPPLPDDVTGTELDAEVRRDLSGLSSENATAVARHLVQVARLLDDDPAAALEHARAAQRRAGRVGAVREAAGLAAYRAGEYEEALRELRTARRLTGSQVHLPVMADCERGLGRPERALEVASGPEAEELDRAGRVELAIVVAGARRDLGQVDAAVLELRLPELEGRVPPQLQEAQARLQEAYDDALAAAGRPVPPRGPGRRGSAQDAVGGGDADEDDDVLLWEEA